MVRTDKRQTTDLHCREMLRNAKCEANRGTVNMERTDARHSERAGTGTFSEGKWFLKANKPFHDNRMGRDR